MKMLIKKIWTKAEIEEEVQNFDWSKLDSLSEEEIESRVEADETMTEFLVMEKAFLALKKSA